MTQEEVRYRELADFLKTRRARLSPEQAGLPADSRRRTPGLRREEVALLAGVGLTWYTWLEQGRNIHVSTSVIESLSRVLQLNPQERLYLHRLANQPLPAEKSEVQATVDPILQHVLDNLVLCPSLVADHRWNVIAWNRAAALVLGRFEEMDELGRNIVWGMFTNPYYRELYVDWEFHAKNLLGRFRVACCTYMEDPWFSRFVEHLRKKDEAFNHWWSMHEVQDDAGTYKKFQHPLAGTLEFASSRFDIPDQSGFRLFVHVPMTDTDTSEKMKHLLETS